MTTMIFPKSLAIIAKALQPVLKKSLEILEIRKNLPDTNVTNVPPLSFRFSL